MPKKLPPGKQKPNTIRVNEWRQANPEAWAKIQKRATIKRKYGLTEEEYEDLKIKAGFRCQICGKHESKLKQGLYVDHCHETGKVRGMLCQLCNFGIGKLGDSYEGVQKAAAYLKKFEEN